MATFTRKQQRELRQSNQVGKKPKKRRSRRAKEEKPVESLSERIIKAVESLDDGNDAHWTRQGHPSMKAIEEVVGDKRITRDMVSSLSDRMRSK